MAEIARAPVTDNVLALMTRAIDRLPEMTRRLLQAAACIGHRFDLGTLAEVTGQPRTSASNELRPALADGLLVASRDVAIPDTIQFVDDRV